jgi:hypothetical protein
MVHDHAQDKKKGQEQHKEGKANQVGQLQGPAVTNAVHVDLVEMIGHGAPRPLVSSNLKALLAQPGAELFLELGTVLPGSRSHDSILSQQCCNR